ncbi:MAG: glutamate racemase [Treponema sp.]|nr:glutamate racemase [Treponema sp.]
MNNKPVLFLDSGIGGLLYCAEFKEKNPRENVFYLADTKNFPYGGRSKEELIFLLTQLTKKIIKIIDPKIIIISCNTATISAIDSLRESFPGVHFVGTVPAIKPAAKMSKTGIVGLLGTARTIDDPYNQSLSQGCEIKGIAAPDLVEFVEKRMDNAGTEEKIKIVRKYIDLFRVKGVDTLVLGCTHFLHLLDEFKREASPGIKVFDSLDGITRRVEFLLEENKNALMADSGAQPVYKMLLTSAQANDLSWQNRSAKMGFALCVLDEI